MDKMSFIINSL